MIKEQVWHQLRDALSRCGDELKLESTDDGLAQLALERPRQLHFGDFAVNVSPLARFAKLPPPKIAEIVCESVKTSAPLLEPSLAGGFVNFKVDTQTLLDGVLRLLQAPALGQNTVMAEDCILLEYVSANPTGPLHIGHGRWMALGNSLARLMKHCGATVWQEFYVNDYGSQMNNIANSVWYRCLQQCDASIPFPEKTEDQPYPFYPGEYVVDIAATYLANDENRAEFEQWRAMAQAPDYQAPEKALEVLKAEAKFQMMAAQKRLLERCGLVFDLWFSETDLHQAGEVADCLQVLKERGYAYEQDGAVWFASSRFDDDSDRVLVKTDGSYTYLTADIAYHWDKFIRDDGCFTKAINIWGADHHGYIPRMKAAIAASVPPKILSGVASQACSSWLVIQRTTCSSVPRPLYSFKWV